mmetsp:Transcript_13238/g.41723  ORF Transcript_13238/g.41723 Transcript_13238/m.41723 type:complete len:290 (+) Transcript_13238:766-1635(+)
MVTRALSVSSTMSGRTAAAPACAASAVSAMTSASTCPCAVMSRSTKSTSSSTMSPKLLLPGTSAADRTARTPGTASASVVSRPRSCPLGTGDMTSEPTSSPGSGARSSVYVATPASCLFDATLATPARPSAPVDSARTNESGTTWRNEKGGVVNDPLRSARALRRKDAARTRRYATRPPGVAMPCGIGTSLVSRASMAAASTSGVTGHATSRSTASTAGARTVVGATPPSATRAARRRDPSSVKSRATEPVTMAMSSSRRCDCLYATTFVVADRGTFTRTMSCVDDMAV